MTIFLNGKVGHVHVSVLTIVEVMAFTIVETNRMQKIEDLNIYFTN